MKKLLGILVLIASLGVIVMGGSSCISGTASKQGLICYVDASLGPVIVIIIVLYLILKKKI